MPTAIIMPKFGMAQESGIIVEWLVEEGQAVRRGDPILRVDTDKVTMEVESPADGILAHVKYRPGAEVPVAETIAYLLSADEAAADAGSAPSAGAPHSAVASPGTVAGQQTREAAAGSGTPAGGHGESVARPAGAPEAAKPTASPVAQRIAHEAGVDLGAVAGALGGRKLWKADVQEYLEQQAGAGGRVRATPAARRQARDRGIDLAQVRGTGPHGRVQADDVAAWQQPVAQPTEARRGEPQPSGPLTDDLRAELRPAAAPKGLSGAEQQTPAPVGGLEAAAGDVRRFAGMRKTIARRMLRNYQSVPHVAFSVDVDMSAALALHERLQQAAPPGLRVSLTALLVKVAGWALTRHPLLNADVDDDETRLQPEANVGVAVALTDGLIVPVIKSAQSKGIHRIAAELNDLAARGQSGRLTPDDVAGGTFTISNLGMFGIDRFTAIINAPEAAILSAGRVAQRIVPDEAGRPVARPMLTLTLSADHRAIDGAVAARFLADLRRGLEEPLLLLG